MNIFSANLHFTARVPPCVAFGDALIAFLFVCALTSCATQNNSQPARPDPHNKRESADLPKDQPSESRPPEQSREKVVSGGKSIGKRVFRGSYANRQYGYSVVIPKGLVGTNARDPAPDHGIGITLSEQPKAHIWTSGLYNGDGKGNGALYSLLD